VDYKSFESMRIACYVGRLSCRKKGLVKSRGSFACEFTRPFTLSQHRADVNGRAGCQRPVCIKEPLERGCRCLPAFPSQPRAARAAEVPSRGNHDV
jgi:hypothetical protein